MSENDALLSEKECIENPISKDNNAYLSYIRLLEMRVELLNDKLKVYQNATCASICTELIQNLYTNHKLDERNMQDIYDACEKFSLLIESKNSIIQNLQYLLTKKDTYQRETKSDLLLAREEVCHLMNIVQQAIDNPAGAEPPKWKEFKKSLWAGEKVFSSSIIQCVACNGFYLRSHDYCPICAGKSNVN